MKTAILIASLLLVACAAPVTLDEVTYTLVRGEPWQGVKIGGEAPRSLNSICRNRLCYTLKEFHVPAYAELERFNLSDLRFDTLAEAPGVTREGDRLYLPPDLGGPLFQEAQRREMRARRREE